MPAQSPTLSPTLSAITAGIARIVLGDARFDLADEVGADVRALGEDAAAQAREDRDQGAAEREAHEGAQRVLGVAEQAAHDEVVAGDAEQPQAHHQHAGDGAAAECDLQGGVEPLLAACAVRTLARTEMFMPM